MQRIEFIFTCLAAFGLTPLNHLKLDRDLFIEPRGIQSISDFSLWGSYKQKFDFGIGYRTQNVMIYKFKIRIKESLSISYL